MEYNFDSDDNIKSAKTPSVKVRNVDDCVEMRKWKGNLIPHDIKTDKEGVTIPGNIIHNPRMLILQRSLLLKVETKTGRILRARIAKESKKENTYMCVRKYFILFVDEDNKPLHEIPLQLTVKGCLQLEFDQQLCGLEV
jgi:penicillin-binding protein-related factor A (putative recombinase)